MDTSLTWRQFRAFTDDVVTVLVGPEKTPYKIHKGILTNSATFFAAAFQEDGFKEGLTHKMELLDVDSGAFYRFVLYCYTGIITNDEEEEPDDELELMYLWIFGDFLGLPKLQDMVMRLLCLLKDKKWRGTAQWPKKIWEQTRRNSPLRSYLIDSWIESEGLRDLVHNEPETFDREFSHDIWSLMVSRAKQWLAAKGLRMPFVSRNYLAPTDGAQ